MRVVNRGSDYRREAHWHNHELGNQFGHRDGAGRSRGRIVMFEALFVPEMTAVSTKSMSRESLRRCTKCSTRRQQRQS